MKKIIKIIIDAFIYLIISTLYRSKLGRVVVDSLIKIVRSKTYSIKRNDFKISFYVPNTLNYFRAKSFFDKEPETLEWIDTFKDESIFWDIGANIGLYSCYAAMKKNCKVIAFEPSPFNLELLSKNIFLNNLDSKINIFPLPLSNSVMNSKLKMSNTELGGALSTFGEKFGHDGNDINSIFELSTYGLSGDAVVKYFNIPQPAHIKIDVDGIEHLILSGCSDILKNTKSVLIEVNEEFDDMFSQVEQILKKNNFTMQEKKQSQYVMHKSQYAKTYNQIWLK